MNIIIKLQTGNDTFRTRGAVARTLEKLGNRFRSNSWANLPTKILDDNGNTVGTLEVEE